jgi:YesN/AraC family two-component response regulator
MIVMLIGHHSTYYWATWSFNTHHDCKDEATCTTQTICCTGDCEQTTQIKQLINNTKDKENKQIVEKIADYIVEETNNKLNLYFNIYKEAKINTKYTNYLPNGTYTCLLKPPIA